MRRRGAAVPPATRCRRLAQQDYRRRSATGDQTDQESRSGPGLALVILQTKQHDSGVNMTSSANDGIKTVLHPVSDLARAKAVYNGLLGVSPHTDTAYYIGFGATGQPASPTPMATSWG
jgi:hypothetical protein